MSDALSEDHIRYDLMVREALRGVLRQVLADAARKGLPGEHHFFISFNTRAPGVRISSRLHAQYPQEMTIVLQHQFWDLTVTDTGMEVGLAFNGIPEKLVVPFDAIKGFFDPSVKFGLEFETEADAAPESSESAAPDAPAGLKPAQPLAPLASPPGKAKTAADTTAEKSAAKPAGETSPPEPPKSDGSGDGGGDGGAEVVRLDRFRKK